jgi:hypothetical protein
MTDQADSPNPFDLPPMPDALMPQVVEVQPATPRRKGGWVVVAALVAALAIGVGVFAATRTSKAAGYSLAAAEGAASKAQNVAFEMNVDIAGTPVTGTARLDSSNRRMALQMKMATLGGSTVSAVFDMAAGVMYMDTSTLKGQGLNAPTRWVSIDLLKFPGMKQAVASQTSTNPLDVARMLAKAKSTKDLGVETLRGEQVKHYLVTVSIADQLAANPDLKAALDKANVKMPDTVDYDVFVTSGNQLRRMKYTMPVAGKTMSYDIILTAVGTIDPIVIPDPKDVTDLSTLTSAG